MSEAFVAAHGVEVADIIMEHLPPEGWGDLATKKELAEQGRLLRSDLETQGQLLRRDLESQGLLLRRDFETQGQSLRSEFALGMSELRGELTEKVSELRVELKDEMAGLRIELKGELADVRSDINAAVERFGKEMSQEFTKQQRWMFTTMGGMFGGTAAIISAVVLLVK